MNKIESNSRTAKTWRLLSATLVAMVTVALWGGTATAQWAGVHSIGDDGRSSKTTVGIRENDAPTAQSAGVHSVGDNGRSSTETTVGVRKNDAPLENFGITCAEGKFPTATKVANGNIVGICLDESMQTKLFQLILFEG